MPETSDAELDSILGTECPACGDTYHDMKRHLELNYKGCADAPELHSQDHLTGDT